MIFPHAGSGAGPWLQWARGIPAWVEVRVARLPGRESRLGEPCLTNPELLLNELERALKGLTPLPTVLFGHSLGAFLAYEMCQRGFQHVSALVVSGQVAPPRHSISQRMAHLPDAELARAAQERWGGIPSEILESAELQTLFIPALRGDLAISESWDAHEGRQLRQDITVISGEDDLELAVEDVTAWDDITSGATHHLRHKGGHMAILTDDDVRRQAISLLLESLAK